MTRSITVYTRERCGLCRQAEAVVADVAAATGAPVEHIDIDADEELTARYGLRVPVVAVDGVDHFEISVDPEALARLVTTPPPP